MTKTHPTTEMKSMDWGHLNELDVQVVTQAVDTCQHMHLQAIMSFNYHWNEEVVTQFYATLYVDRPGKKFHWMLQGEKYSVTYRQFADMLGFPDADLERPKIHDENVIDDAEMHFMYDEAYGDVKFGETSGLIPYYNFMNQILRYTLSPKAGNSDRISNMSRNLLAKMTPGSSEFSVFDFLWEEIICTSISPKRGYHYAPYIFHMIKEVTGINILADQDHLVSRPNKGTVD